MSLLCDVGPVDERGPWAPAWAVKKVDHDNPASYKAALKREDKDKWIEAWNLECHNWVWRERANRDHGRQ